MPFGSGRNSSTFFGRHIPWMDNSARVLLGLKLKERALEWFHSKLKNLELPIHQLLEQIRNLFDYRPVSCGDNSRKESGKTTSHSVHIFTIKLS